MCVNRVEYNFHPKLNWIIGANGTGKSTIVCALYLVFNGKVGNLGRSTSIAQYINNRKPDVEAFIEAEIYESANRNRIISRVWKSSGSDKWTLDNKGTTKSSIQAVLNKLNIQVENLLQFLPQEKVSTFNSLSDVARLQKFEEAIMAADGKSNLSVIHNNLIEYEENAHKSSEKLDEGRRELEGLHADENRLKDRVEKWEQFTAKEKECYFLNLKRLNIINEYAEMKNAIIQREYNHLKGQAEGIKEELIGKTRQKVQILEADWKKREKIYDSKIDLASDENKEIISQLKKLEYRIDRSILDTLENEENEYKRQVKKFHKGMTEIKNRTETLALRENENQLQRNEYEENKENWEAELKIKEGQRKEAREQSKKAEDTMRLRQDEKRGLKHKFQQLEERKKKQGDVIQRRKQSLRLTLHDSQIRSMIDAIGLIESNSERFENPVIQPAILTLNPNMEILSILLDHISISQMIHFYALNAHDNLALQRLTKSADVPVSFFGNPRELELDYWRTQIDENIRIELAKLGFEYTLLDYLKGPNEILCAMAKWGRAHTVYITKSEPTSDQRKKLEKIAGHLSKFTYYIHGDKSQCVTMKKMQFSAGDVSTQSKAIVMRSRTDEKVAPFLVKESEHAGELDRLIREVKVDLERVDTEWKEYQEQYAKYKKIDAALQTDCAQLKSSMQGGKGLSLTIKTTKENIQKNFNDLPDIIEAQKRLKRHRLKASKEFSTVWAQFAKLYVDLVDQFPSVADTTPTIARIFMKMNHLRAKMREEQDRLKDQENQVSEKLDELTTSKNRAQRSKNEYEEFKKIYFHKYEEMKEKDLQQKLRQIKCRTPEPAGARQGSSINVEVYSEWLDQFKEELNTRYDLLKTNVDEDRENIDSDIHMQAKQYEELKKAITAKQKGLDKLVREFDEKKKECQRLKETWLPELDALVSDVSKRLKTYFKQISCDGEVSINRPDNPSSYSKYELQIKVRFRDSVPLEALNVGRQSGGERSVSTMLFLLAMPTKNCPFRLVDEINQGMDQQNERNVIDVLSNVSNSPNCCQFFIITPKLLPNIDFPDNSRIHIVHSIPNPFPFQLNDTAHCLEDRKDLE